MSSPIRPVVKRIRVLFLGGLLISFAYSMQLQRHRQIEVPPPAPPAPVEAGADAATLNLKIVERGSDIPVSATVSVNGGAVEGEEAYLEHSLRRSANRHKGPIRFRPLNYYFYTDGTLSLKVPPGRCTVEVRKGYEYVPSHRTFELDPGQVLDASVTLSRWIDMAALGWYSGDTHIHFDRTGTNDDSLLTLTSARDIRYAFSLSMNTRGYSLGGAFESWHQAHGLGDGSIRNRGPYYLTSGQEYRTRTLGHVTILMAPDYVPGAGHTPNTDRGPSLGVIGDQARELGGVIGLNHGGYTRLEADSLALSGKMDFLELLQFGGYRGLGLDGWYDFLNLGYRWPMAGASDYPATRELGDCITYVRASEPPTPQGFIEGLLRGESFATSGPMLLVTVNGKQPGESILANEKTSLDLQVEIRVSSPLYPVRYVDLIRNGRVVSRDFSAEGRSHWELSRRIEASSSGWVAVRAYSDAGTEAHTNPVYVYFDGKLPFDDDACGQILARLDSSLRAIPAESVVARVRKLRDRLARYRDTGNPQGLALPSIAQIAEADGNRSTARQAAVTGAASR
ncbi:MAG: CehA/McbA family metallohydrolase [Candidatus Aminicenantes bacterium]|nr:CehA/McbA family metallohydrolase [Candidatus Aminicenantes bacterium]